MRLALGGHFQRFCHTTQRIFYSLLRFSCDYSHGALSLLSTSIPSIYEAEDEFFPSLQEIGEWRRG